MTIFIMMVGLSGSGKSVLAEKLCTNQDYCLVSSDSYRKKNYGDDAKQGDNAKLFEEIHRDILENLRNGRSVVFDATNLTYKTRVPLLEKVSKVQNVTKAAVVVATQYSLCIERNKNRERVVPEYVIKRQREQFQMPQYAEGWDTIELQYDVYNNPSDYNSDDYLVKIENYNQDTPYHTMTLGAHTSAVAENVLNLGGNFLTHIAALYHDNGKLYTKVFKNARGEPSEIAHYYGHESVGAYEAMFYLAHNGNFSYRDIIYICGLITYHMRPYTTNTEKSVSKTKRMLGEKMYADLMVLHEADKKGH